MLNNDIILRRVALSTFKDRIKWSKTGSYFLYRKPLGKEKYIKMEVYTTMTDQLFLVITLFHSGRIKMNKIIMDSEREILKKAFIKKNLI